MFPAQAEVRLAKMPIEKDQKRFGPYCLSSSPRAFCPHAAATQLGRQEAAPRRGLFTFRRCLEEEGGELSSKSINLLRARVERERERVRLRNSGRRRRRRQRRRRRTKSAKQSQSGNWGRGSPRQRRQAGLNELSAESILLRKATRSLNAVSSPTAVFMLSRRAAD